MPDWIFCHQVLEAQQPETALDHLRAHGTAAEAQLLQDCSSAYNPGVLLNSSVVVFLFLFCLFFSLSPLNLYKMKWRVFSFSTELLYRVWRSVGKLTPSRLFFFKFFIFFKHASICLTLEVSSRVFGHQPEKVIYLDGLIGSSVRTRHARRNRRPVGAGCLKQSKVFEPPRSSVHRVEEEGEGFCD